MPTTTRAPKIRGNQINVKSYADLRVSPDDAALIERYGEMTVEVIYEQCLEQFWADAEIAAKEAGYSGVTSDGRSGGWLVPMQAGREVEEPEDQYIAELRAEYRTPDWQDAEIIDDAERFHRFAAEMTAMVEHYEGYFWERVAEVRADAEQAREAKHYPTPVRNQFDNAARVLADLREAIEEHEDEDSEVLAAMDRALDAFDQVHSDVKGGE